MVVELRERLTGFGLTLHEDKTRLIEFGRFAAHTRRRRGVGRPETFAFLGFTHSIPGRSPAQLGKATAQAKALGEIVAQPAEAARGNLSAAV